MRRTFKKFDRTLEVADTFTPITLVSAVMDITIRLD